MEWVKAHREGLHAQSQEPDELLIISMSHWKLGDHAEALRNFQVAELTADSPPCANDPFFQTLFREARQLIQP